MPSDKRALGLILLSVFLFSVAVVFATALYRSNSLPLINGVIIPKGQALSNFNLLSHKNKTFTNQNLLGNWHIVSYGYTDCPDICPTTLATLARVEKKVISSNQYTDVKILFYTIDPQRDTVQKLADYMPFFSSRFIGLTPAPHATESTEFEQSLGIQTVLTPLAANNTNFKGYSVSHGVMLYLLNSKGELQAVLKPDTTPQGVQSFSSDQIYQDYFAVRKYFASKG